MFFAVFLSKAIHHSVPFLREKEMMVVEGNRKQAFGGIIDFLWRFFPSCLSWGGRTVFFFSGPRLITGRLKCKLHSFRPAGNFSNPKCNNNNNNGHLFFSFIYRAKQSSCVWQQKALNFIHYSKLHIIIIDGFSIIISLLSREKKKQQRKLVCLSCRCVSLYLPEKKIHDFFSSLKKVAQCDKLCIDSLKIVGERVSGAKIGR